MRLRKRKYAQRYDWATWFKLRKFKLIKGLHYRYNSYIFAQMVRNAAVPSRFNKRVSITIDPLDRFIIVKVRNRDESVKKTKKQKQAV